MKRNAVVMQRTISSFFADPNEPSDDNIPGGRAQGVKYKTSNRSFTNGKTEKTPNSKDVLLQGSSREERASVQPSTCYEEIRAARIRAREALFQDLGLSEELSQLSRTPGAKPQPTTKRKPKPPQSQEPLRRSTRKRGMVKESDLIFFPLSGHPAQEEEAWEAAESSVKRYMLDVDPEQYRPSHSWEQTGSFQVEPYALQTMGLPRAYSVDWLPGLFVAGGKSGAVSLWGLELLRNVDDSLRTNPDQTIIRPLLEAQLHKGWVADVQFWGPVGTEDIWLLTAGNDGKLRLWDVQQSVTTSLESGMGTRTRPRMLCETTPDSEGGAGIFSIHRSSDGSLLSAGKDGNITLYKVLPSGSFQEMHAYYDAHDDGVVKSVRWQEGGSIFASSGNDRCIRIWDVRDSSKQPAIEVENVHDSSVNSVRWQSGDANVSSEPHLLASTSHDPLLRVHDVRHPAEPLYEFSEAGKHRVRRIASIYQPAWLPGSDRIACSSEGSRMLSIYCCRTGKVVSRGDASGPPLGPLVPASILWNQEAKPALFACANRVVQILSPMADESNGA